ncbi:hypothetical protein [Deinococcus maricopensis]|uniref:Lipoprotein n=1 Tax=Deinococcus maricopensis (strain DSM 21211 / LMG 22137 / NRRL B-23946 / LB-34) TaxID=709986 RepID=E8U8P6_DEIML|nr:hypothetical protein [Deinococcus maricopensis]ADV67435.1 hypothetical protein Deima_1787 [Deinococcus maricopensis DSM 21211]
MKRFLTVLTLTLLAPSASAVAILGHLSNAAVLPSLMGTDQDVYVWLTNMTQGRVVSRAALKDGTFLLNIPAALALPTRPLDVCSGVTVKPARVPVYQTETLVLYNRAHDRLLGPLVQADDPRTPTRIVRWMYSDVAATVQGRCTGLNTTYNLKLRKGWNGVMTVSTSGNFHVTNPDRNLPYWLLGDLKLDQASRTLPASFFRQP